MARREKIQKVEKNLKACEQELARIEAINRKIKDPNVQRQVKTAKDNLKAANKKFVNWLKGVGALAGVTASSIALFVAVTKLSRLIGGTSRTVPTPQPAPAQQPVNPSRNTPRDYFMDPMRNSDLQEIRTMFDPQRRASIRQQGQADINATNERLRREMAERQAQREHAQGAAAAIGRVQNAIRELDLEERNNGPVNSPGDQRARFSGLDIDPPPPNSNTSGNHYGRFSGLDLDSGYKIKRPKRKHVLVTHDSMPWSYSIRHLDESRVVEKSSYFKDKLQKVARQLKKYAGEHPKLAKVFRIILKIIWVLNKISSAGANAGIILLGLARTALLLSENAERAFLSMPRETQQLLGLGTFARLEIINLLNRISAYFAKVVSAAITPDEEFSRR